MGDWEETRVGWVRAVVCLLEIELCLLKGMRGETGAARGVFGEGGWRVEGGRRKEEREKRKKEEGRWRGGGVEGWAGGEGWGVLLGGLGLARFGWWGG